MHDPFPRLHLPLPLARQATDRDHASRAEPGLLERLWAEPGTRVLCLRGDGRALREAGGLRLIGPRLIAAAPPASGSSVYLGRTAKPGRYPVDTPVLSLCLDESQALRLGRGDEAWGDLRAIACELDEIESGLFTAALAMRNWHDSHAFSPRTGAATVIASAGWVRSAPGDGHAVFPRTDAAVIAAVIDRDDRILLGRNAAWSQPRFSLLAGFVEPGESFEAAVAREVFEESGARIARPRYVGSQPWPFPASIMVGFVCELDAGQDPGSVRPDGNEIVEVRWWTRQEIAGRPELLPGPASIARMIIEDWYGGPLG